MEPKVLLKKRLVRIDTDVHCLLEEIKKGKGKKLKKKKLLEEFKELQHNISNEITEPLDPTRVIRDMRTKDYLI